MLTVFSPPQLWVARFAQTGVGLSREPFDAPLRRPEVKEDERVAVIWVMRKDGCSADVSCSYRTENGTAIAGSLEPRRDALHFDIFRI